MTPVSAVQIDALVAKLGGGEATRAAASRPDMPAPLRSLAAKSAWPETLENVARVKRALTYISPDTPRGSGRLFEGNGKPTADTWLGVIWAIAWLSWRCGEGLAREWSRSSSRYDDQGFGADWRSYNHGHPTPVTVASLFALARANGWNEGAAQPVTGLRYRLLGRADVLALAPSRWRLKGILPETGLAAIYGPSGSGKSFLVLDLGAAVAAGTAWFGSRTAQCDVTIVMLEGAGGLLGRVKAWEAQHRAALPGGLRFVTQPFDLTRPEDVDALCEVLPLGGVVILDTMNRAAPSIDENSSKDMGTVLQALKQLETATGGLVIVVHHTGKDAARGMRGHSSLHAALDAAIEVERKAEGRSWRLAKAKDGDDGRHEPFRLVRHVLGVDPDGDEITSCSVARGGQAVYVRPPPSGKSQCAALSAITAGLAVAAPEPPTPGLPDKRIKVPDAVTAVAGALPSTASSKRSYRARQLIADLLRNKHLQGGTDPQGGKWLW